MELTHLGVAVIMDDYNKISAFPIWLRFPDGIWRRSYIMMAGWLADQQEQDKMCAETSQRCKQCVCPKDRLHEPHTVWERHKPSQGQGRGEGRAQGRLSREVARRNGPAQHAPTVQAGHGPQEQEAPLDAH